MVSFIKRRYAKGRNPNVVVSNDGNFSFNKAARDKLKWTPGCRIKIWDFVHSQAKFWISLFARSDEDNDGYIFHPNSGPDGGGYLSLTGLLNDCFPDSTLRPNQIEPIYMEHTNYDLALMLKAPEWDNASIARIESGDWAVTGKGVYQFLSAKGIPLRIGCGDLTTRPDTHLDKIPELAVTSVKLEYFLLPGEDRELMEQILLSRFVCRHGVLPQFQKIHR